MLKLVFVVITVAHHFHQDVVSWSTYHWVSSKQINCFRRRCFKDLTAFVSLSSFLPTSTTYPLIYCVTQVYGATSVMSYRKLTLVRDTWTVIEESRQYG